VFWQLLSAVAFAVAVPLAWGIIRAVTASLTTGLGLTKFPTVTPDAGVLAATALLTLMIGLTMGVVSAWRSRTVAHGDGQTTAPFEQISMDRDTRSATNRRASFLRASIRSSRKRASTARRVALSAILRRHRATIST
jgi:hypothetical protein